MMKFYQNTVLYKMYDRLMALRGEKKLLEKRKKIMLSYNPNKQYLNIGGGKFIKENWQILDYADYPFPVLPKHLIDFNVNLVKVNKLPISDNSYDLVYTSHCLEHIGNNAVEMVINEVKRILKPGGIFRITVPDADKAYKAYKNKDLSFFEQLNNQKDKRNIDSRFLDFFSPITLDEIDVNKFRQDFLHKDMADFFNSYIPQQINFETHNFSTHIC